MNDDDPPLCPICEYFAGGSSCPQCGAPLEHIPGQSQPVLKRPDSHYQDKQQRIDSQEL